MRTARSVSLLFALLGGVTGCSDPSHSIPPTAVARPGIADVAPADVAFSLCRARAASVRSEPDQGGAPAFEERRTTILGTARGEPLVLVREPRPTPDEVLTPAQQASRRAFEGSPRGKRVTLLKSRHRGDPAGLRALLLRDGYVYTSEPQDALAMVTALSLPELFDEPEVWLLRGKHKHRLRRVVEGRTPRTITTYRHAEGTLAGRRAELLFGDRLALTEDGLGSPLHRDLRSLAEDIGLDRVSVLHRTEHALVVELRVTPQPPLEAAPVHLEAVLASDGAALRLDCVLGDADQRALLTEAQRATAWKRRALMQMRATVDALVEEGNRFDRPLGEEGPDRDGQLRPVWMSAYLRGLSSFRVDEVSYPVFDPAGKPWPPQVCVDFVLDTYERAAGTWFTGQGMRAARVRGQLDFDDTGIPNRRGVLPLGDFAATRPDLFEVRRFQREERVPFGERRKFFQFLAERADDFKPGDIVAIHGLKRDERIHQHALLVEWSDPVTGFPAGLADQMKRPRRRTWEGIMAEAPKRSLYYRVRPSPELLRKLDPEPR
ncbi:hypothetical protein [Chondromyces crocatus]|uniref:Lipoprotein n=1 Tax=Chondromyces crocatus TaxID=52 RepID=A0A0K1E894_CHOCO|nr:hypothetical protein [Chondromyces crocatus]AKT37091.1 uncharacterized protein CMC5_012170 [Chondromyces crocatus]